MQPLIKWPGGKTAELGVIENHLPEKYSRYVEPFFGGGALFFEKCPKSAIINDISKNLMSFYRFIGSGNEKFEKCAYGIVEEWELLKEYCGAETERFFAAYYLYADGDTDREAFSAKLVSLVSPAVDYIADRSQVISDKDTFRKELNRMVADKLFRTAANEKKFGALSEEDLKKNVLTGFTAGYYMYMRAMLNAMEKDKFLFISEEYKAAVFFFVREFCYGSMFRYNKNGDFNVPYGGIAYNGKDFRKKVDALFNREAVSALSSAEIHSEDFGKIFALCGENDFIFLDPPYDTDFSDYETNVFGKTEHKRLAECVYNTRAKFLLIIKNTPFIESLYAERGYNIFAFDNEYAYCVKGRNDRKAEHLIITNY
ncbi:MAG: DNA adenine methylase [Clostridia bacterium]|nr:DNA adenine methylase [Clostridia bacterium]